MLFSAVIRPVTLYRFETRTMNKIEAKRGVWERKILPSLTEKDKRQTQGGKENEQRKQDIYDTHTITSVIKSQRIRYLESSSSSVIFVSKVGNYNGYAYF